MQAHPNSPHSFAQGRPSKHVFQTVSTEHVDPAQRYSYWSEDILRSAQTERPNQHQRYNFNANVTSLATLSGEMHFVQSDAFTAHITQKTIRQAPCDALSLLLIVDGKVTQVFDDGSSTTKKAGEFLLLDGRRPMSMCLTQNTTIQVDLSRPLLESVFPGAMPDARPIARVAPCARPFSETDTDGRAAGRPWAIAPEPD